ncbi:asparagine synthase (glutamine-hydrolysing) [Nocardiopsis flavescens]|uniref:asparagine synthase (glutamine-hydrolyzing) n=1 Tax=Nocardiopsis flavescens TaxID=758803 RepID=A0A1M6M0J8_9ACTN|nr:asparagine synthetase B [Nocardiopsis flavescens]SHJ76997.1 asparagine synthase (glutamine-hydrolysing) [Nocardiopsis flavescens]
MCGVAGLAGPDAHLHTDTVTAMSATQRHRGPDGTRTACTGDGHAVMAMNILKIVDPTAENGPYSDPATGLMLVVNGEVFNHREIVRQRDIALGPGETDAHVLLRAWAQAGPRVLEEAEGMFALAVYDPRRRTLHLARDRFGEKPLYWRADGSRIAFASEVAGLIGYGPAPVVYRPEMAALETPIGTDTPYQGIQLLPPGNLLTFDLRSASITHTRWWDLAATEPATTTYTSALDQAVDLLESTVAGRAHSGRSALLLSGGLDSALLAHLLRPEVCVTVRYPGRERFDESATAARVARTIGAELLVVEPGPGDLRAELGRIVSALDYPVGNASLLSEHMAYRAIADAGIRVVYGGLGPDELLMGYARHALTLFGPRAVEQGLDAYRPLAAKLLHDAGPDRGEQETVTRLIARGPDPQNRVSSLVADCFERAGGDTSRALTLVELATAWRPLVSTSDKLASAFGLERRSPYLARGFAEFCYSLPVSHKITRPALGKRILRDAARELGVGQEVWAATDKKGFASPVPAWLNDPGLLSPWCEESIRTALTTAPSALLPLLKAGLEPAARFDRTRAQALLTAYWVAGSQRHAA